MIHTPRCVFTEQSPAAHTATSAAAGASAASTAAGATAAEAATSTAAALGAFGLALGPVFLVEVEGHLAVKDALLLGKAHQVATHHRRHIGDVEGRTTLGV